MSKKSDNLNTGRSSMFFRPEKEKIKGQTGTRPDRSLSGTNALRENLFQRNTGPMSNFREKPPKSTPLEWWR